MRIAVCFSGGFRSFKRCWPIYQKNLIELNSAHKFDFFFSSWKVDSQTLFKFHIEKLNLNIGLQDILHRINPVNYFYSNFSDEIKNTGICLSKFSDIRKNCGCTDEVCEKCGGLLFYNHIGQLLNIMISNSLKEGYEQKHNFVYDRVIRARFDYILTRKIVSSIIENIKENEIVVKPNDRDTPDSAADTFAIGHSVAMNYYSMMILSMRDTFDIIKKYTEDFPHRNLYYRITNSHLKFKEENNVYGIVARKFSNRSQGKDILNII